MLADDDEYEGDTYQGSDSDSFDDDDVEEDYESEFMDEPLSPNNPSHHQRTPTVPQHAAPQPPGNQPVELASSKSPMRAQSGSQPRGSDVEIGVVDGDVDEPEEEEDEDPDRGFDEGTEQAVSVIVRVRPGLEGEDEDVYGQPLPDAVTLPDDSPDTLQVVAREGQENEFTMRCSFDRILPAQTTQQEVFESTGVKSAVLGVAKGISACVFAYGQTSAGKTHTMLGEEGGAHLALVNEGNQWGVIPRSVESLFGALESEGEASSSFSYAVHCSMLQIYNEQLHDLLSSSAQFGEGEALKIREVASMNSDPEMNGVELYVAGLSQYRVSSVHEVMALLQHGTRARAVRSTEYNETSSRSHAILQLLVETEAQDASGITTMRRAKLSLVDLAGSEKMNVTKQAPNMTKRHLQELTSINKSLSCLGNVIAILADISAGKAKPNAHVPYRDSKLTRLLQDSLGGNTRTVVIACVAPGPSFAMETVSTLKFADRAKKVMARIRANERVDDKVLLKRAYAEIKHLRRKLKSLQSQLQLFTTKGHEGGMAGASSAYNPSMPPTGVDRTGGGMVSEFDGGSGDVVVMLKRENVGLKDENRKLKDRVKKLMQQQSKASKKRKGKSKRSPHKGRYGDDDDLDEWGGLMKPSPSMLWGDEGADGMNHVQAMEDEEFRQDVIPPDIALMLEEIRDADQLNVDGLSESDHELDDIHEQLADMRDPESRSRALTMAHKQCRLDIEDEAMHLSSLRNEREELERQLRAMMMGAGECDPVEEEDSEGLDEEEDSDIKRSPARYEPPRTEDEVTGPPDMMKLMMQQSSPPSKHRHTHSPSSPHTHRSTEKDRKKAKKTAPLVFPQVNTHRNQPPQESERFREAHAVARLSGMTDSEAVSVQDHWPAPVHNRRKRLQKALEQCMEPQSAEDAMKEIAPQRPPRYPSAHASVHSDSSRERGEDGLSHSGADVGARISVYSYRYDAYYPATIVSYDRRRRMHCCVYEGAGDKQWHDLKHKTFKLLEYPSSSSPVSHSSSIPTARSTASQSDPRLSPTHSEPATHTTAAPSPRQRRGSSRGSSRSRSHRSMSKAEAAAAAKRFMASPYLQDPGFVRPSSRTSSRGSQRSSAR